MDTANVADSLAGLADFFTYFGSALALTVLFCIIYCWVTPYPEITLIRKGKTSAAISFGGAIVGFVIPLGSAISQSVSFTDMLIWSIIALAVQIAVFFGLKLVFANLTREIEENHAAPATLMAFCSVACGILNAACMTY